MLPIGVPASVAFDPFLILFLAVALDAGLGEPAWLFRFIPHPVVVIGNLIGWFERRLNRPNRSQGARRRRGILTVLILTGLGGLVGWGAQVLAMRAPYGWVLELFLLFTLIAQRSLSDHVAAVADGLRDGGLAGGRAAVSRIVGRDPERLDGPGVCRAAIESCAENFSDGVVAPIFWYVLFGLPGIIVYKVVNTLDSMIGHRNDRYRAFGWAAARLDDVMNLIPARLAGLLLAVGAAFVPGGSPWGAIKTMLRDARKHRSPNAGWPEGATAGALGIALAGPRAYPGYVVNDPWIGDGRAKLSEVDIRRSIKLLWVGWLLNIGWIVGLWLTQLSLG